MDESSQKNLPQVIENPPSEVEEKKIFNEISFAIWGLLILAIFYSLYFARAVVLPIVIALLLNFLLSPLIRGLKKIWIPQHLGALLVILIFFLTIAAGFNRLAAPLGDWLSNTPNIIPQATQKITHLILPLNKSLTNVFNIQAQIEKTTASASPPEKNVQVVSIKENKWVGAVFNGTLEFFLQLGLIVMLLYFLLSSNDFFLRKLVEIMPHFAEKKETVTIIREIERKISYFLVWKILISIGLAIAISFAMFILKMPNPILWGVLGGFLELIPYLGVLLGTIMVGFSAILAFDSIGQILLVPAVFFILCSIEGNFVLPLVLSRRMILHPIIIFVGVIFWGWIWGIAGALIAIPLISIVKIICDNIKPLNQYGKFLGEERPENLNP